MVAGGGGRALKVRILGDASGAVRAAKETEVAFKGLDDQSNTTSRTFASLASKVSASVSIIGKGLAATTAAFTVATVGWGVAGAAAIGGIAAAAIGASAAVAGLGIVFAAQSEVVKNEWALVMANMQKGMQEASRAFEPVLLNLMHKLNGVFMEFKPGITFLLNAMAPVVEKFGAALIDGFRALTPLFVDLVKLGTPFVAMLAEHIVPLFEKIATFTPSTFLVELIRDMVPVFQQLAPVVASLIGMFGMLGGPVVGALREALPALSGFLTALADNLGPLLGTIATELGGVLSQALTALAPLLPILGDAIGKLVETLGPVLGEVLSILGPSLIDVFDKLLPPVQKILDALAPILPVLAELAGTVLVALADAITPVVDALAPFITQLVDQLKPVFEDLKPIIEDFGKELGPVLADNLKTILPPLLDLTEALLPIIPPLVNIIAQFLIFEQHMRGEVIQYLIDEFKKIPPVFDQFMDGLRDIGDVMMNVAGWIRTAWDWVWQKIEGFVSWVTGTVVPAIETFAQNIYFKFQFIKAVAMEVWDRIRSKIDEVVGFIQNLPSSISNAVSGMWEGLKNGFRDAINWIVDKWNGFSLPSVTVGGVTIGGDVFPDIPRLHTGGTFRAPTAGGEGLAMLRDGEVVSTPGGRGGGDIYLQVVPVDGKYIIREVTNVQRQGARTPWVQVPA